MATEDIHTQSFNVRDLPTHSVTIFPHKAQVVRVIEDVVLKPGLNHIEILGLSPTVDEGSIKVDGHGKASISGTTVESVRNPVSYVDVYDSDDDEDDLDKPDYRRLPDKPDKLQKLERECRKLTADVRLLDEEIKTANSSIQSMEKLTATVGKDNLDSDEIEKRIVSYNQTATKYAQRIQDAEEKRVPLVEELPKLQSERTSAYLAYQRDTKAIRKEIDRAELKWQRTRKARKAARRERFEERSKFWPLKVYKITVVLERLSDARMISGQSSTTGEQDAADETPPLEEDQRVSLSLYYVTSEASWTPAYDISVDSSAQSGTLVYRAEVSNQTSETWGNAQITLSTSQTSFKGLRDPIPELQPWHVRLLKGRSDGEALISWQEKSNLYQRQTGIVPVNRQTLFGVRDSENPFLSGIADDSDSDVFEGFNDNAPNHAKPPAFGGMAPMTAFATARFGGVAPPPPPPAPSGAYIAVDGSTTGAVGGGGRRQKDKRRMGSSEAEAEGYPASRSRSAMDPFVPMEVADAAWEESGMTAAWDLSGQRTIAPSSNKHRHRIAIIALSELELKHVCVPKIRPDAFLTMRLRNPTDQTILPGEAGLTLDGAFLGTTTLKRIAPGAKHTVSLGVDEGIVVAYSKPVEKRNLTSGIINKDASTAFSRQVTLRHTKTAGGAIEITVHDQIPVCMDERIRMELSKPRGLRAIGDAVRTGEAVRDKDDGSAPRASIVSSAEVARAGTGREEPWGRATASLGKEGSIDWKVKLNPGQKVALPLEYEMRFPAGESLTAD